MDMSEYPTPSFPIKQWAEDDRPREKFRDQGRQYVSDAELIAILLGSGKRGQSALSLAQSLLGHFDHKLPVLARASPEELTRIPGIGQVKAIKILAALELGNRKQLDKPTDRPHIRSSKDAFDQIKPVLEDLNHEEFWTLYLNRANRVIHRGRISSGGLHGTVVDARMILKMAIEKLASSIILCHNHPSGNARPSQADLDLTKRIVEASNMIDLKVLDHIIVAGRNYLSFADEGFL